MIERYTLPEMGEIWSEENKYRSWLKVEVAAAQAMGILGSTAIASQDDLFRRSEKEIADFIQK